MFPVLFSFGSFSISTLGVLSFLAFLVGLFLFWRRGKEEGLEEEKLLDLAFLGAFLGLITGRLGFILEHWPQFNWNLSYWLDFQKHGGFSFWAGVGGEILLLWFLRKKTKWDFWIVSDMLIFSVIVAQVLVRLGQFLDGSFIGKSTDLAIGLGFPGIEGKRFPVQLFEAAFAGGLYFWLKHLEKQYRLFTWYQDKRGEAQPGFLVLTYLFFYSGFRFLLDFFREFVIYWGNLAISQWLALLGLAAAMFGFFYKMGRVKDLAQALVKTKTKIKIKNSVKPILSEGPKKRQRAKKEGEKHIKIGRDVK